jgi:hypothetical protein
LALEAGELRQRANNCTDDEDGLRTARELRERADKLEATGLHRYSTELAEAFDLDNNYIQHCVSLSRAFDPCFRNQGLTVKHHIVILNAVGGVTALKNKSDMDRALKWLADAEQNNWRASELRKRVNMARATLHAPTKPAEENQYPELDKADAWAIRHAEDRIETQEAAFLTTRFAALIKFLDNVRAAAERVA